MVERCFRVRRFVAGVHVVRNQRHCISVPGCLLRQFVEVVEADGLILVDIKVDIIAVANNRIGFTLPLHKGNQDGCPIPEF